MGTVFVRTNELNTCDSDHETAILHVCNFLLIDLCGFVCLWMPFKLSLLAATFVVC